MLAQHCVPQNTPVQDWIAQLRGLTGGLSCFGDSCPSEPRIICSVGDGPGVQYPEISTFLTRKLKAVSALDAMWDLLREEVLKEIFSEAKVPTHVKTGKIATVRSAPRIHVIMHSRTCSSLEPAKSLYELSSNREGYQLVSRAAYSVSGTPRTSPSFHFCKYSRDSRRGKAETEMGVAHDVYCLPRKFLERVWYVLYIVW